MDDCDYQEVEVKHQTMLYGNGAQQIVDALVNFYTRIKDKLPEAEMASN